MRAKACRVMLHLLMDIMINMALMVIMMVIQKKQSVDRGEYVSEVPVEILKDNYYFDPKNYGKPTK
jgi:hypothetical protein